MTNNSSAIDMGAETTDVRPNQDGAAADDLGQPAEDTGPEALTITEWSRTGGCLLDFFGPIVIYGESTEPAACVRVVMVYEETDTGMEGRYPITNTRFPDAFWSQEVRLTSGSCDGTYRQPEVGVAATSATGTTSITPGPLAEPEGLAGADVTMEFPADEDAAFAVPLTATLKFEQESSLEDCPM